MVSTRALNSLNSDLTHFFAPFFDISKELELSPNVYDLSVGNIKHIKSLNKKLKEFKSSHLMEAFLFSRNYPGTQGFMELNTRLAELIKKETGKSFSPNEIVLTNGAVEAISTSLFVYSNCDEKTYYAIPSFPYWAMCDKAEVEGEYFFVKNFQQYAKNFGLEFSKIAEKDKKIKTIILDQPHGPFGANLEKNQLKIINDTCKEKKIKIIFDDVYRTLNNGTWCGNYIDAENSVIVDSLSKRCAFPGLRLGFIAAPEREIKFLRAAIANECIGVSNAVSVIASNIIDFYNENNLFEEIAKEIKKRQTELNTNVKKFKKFGITSPKPDGSLYRVLDLGEFTKNTKISSTKLAEKLAKNGVKVIPNKHFYPDEIPLKNQTEFIRISIGGDYRIKEAVEKTVETLEEII